MQEMDEKKFKEEVKKNHTGVRWDMMRVFENQTNEIADALEGGFEPFAVVPMPVHTPFEQKVQFMNAIFFKRPSRTEKTTIFSDKN